MHSVLSTINIYMTIILWGLMLPHAAKGENVVGTPSGDLRGFIKNTTWGPVTQFLGVPFAQPPLQDLRFKPPESLKPWATVKDSLAFSSACFQHIDMKDIRSIIAFKGDEVFLNAIENATFDEDCLYLNIYMPGEVHPNKTESKKAVMVWTSGNDGYLGSGNWYDGSALATENDVIVVTLNFRLNTFGYFAYPSLNFPGNLALFDQVEALRWVQKHIGAFGGDANKVTFFGEAYGGEA
jgi:carboxylesterase type B